MRRSQAARPARRHGYRRSRQPGAKRTHGRIAARQRQTSVAPLRGLRLPGLRVYPACTIMWLMAPFVVALLLTLGQFGQSNTGELRVTVTDSSGLPLPGPVEVVSDANEFHQRIETDSAGMATVRRLPFGSYKVA